jgi:DNA-directed RNA polymerase alpha subunit
LRNATSLAIALDPPAGRDRAEGGKGNRPEEAMVDKRESDIGIWEAPIRIPFQERGFSDRTINALIDCQIDLPERLLFMSKKQLKLLRGIGETSMAEIVAYRGRFLTR